MLLPNSLLSVLLFCIMLHFKSFWMFEIICSMQKYMNNVIFKSVKCIWCSMFTEIILVVVFGEIMCNFLVYMCMSL